MGPRGVERVRPDDVHAALLAAAGVLVALVLVVAVLTPRALVVDVARAPEAAEAAGGDGAAVGTAGRPVPSVPAAPTDDAPPPTLPSTEAPAGAGPDPDAVAREDVLAALGSALQRRDRAALAGVDPAGWQAAGGDEASYRALTGLPVTRFTSAYVADSLAPEGAEGTAGWTARVRTTYGLGAAVPVERLDTVRLEGSAGAWRPTGWQPWPEEGAIGTSAPWDLGPVAAFQGERSLVLAWLATGAGQPGPRTAEEATAWARQVAGWADTGSVTVDSFVGTGWPQVSLVLAPATTAQFEALTPGERPGTEEVLAALTTDVTTPEGPGDVVLLNPTARGDLVPDTWQVTVTHELVHVAAGARWGDDQELWLAEGLADLVGWSTVVPGRVDRELVAARLLSRVGRGEAAVDRLPPPEAFAGSDPDTVGDAYEGAWLAALLLQDEIGTDALLELYAAASDPTAGADPVARTDAALRAATGQGRDAFEQRWGDYVTALAAGAG
ncbi:hypothetical protein [Aquipuribacter nitratireducens]|uniref:Peptidase MA-like domain-containing protein n=1 Tax=Aquipuribacter nitratireducens TaxID=650104 RepID=A0ABW0GQM3_9MICO